MTKGSIRQEDITIINIQVPDIRVSEHMKPTAVELKGEIDSFTTVAGDVNIPLPITDSASRRKINKEMMTSTTL